MKYYHTGELEKLLGVKGHIIRYWEKEIPILQPIKDGRGKYKYSMRDVQLLMRIKYLLVDRKYTVEGAYEEIFREISGVTQDLKAEIEAMRAELLDVYFINRNRL